MHRRDRGAAQTDGVVHDSGRRRHGGSHAVQLRGRRQGAERRHRIAAGQPPARLPDLRQGWRVPAAEPDDDQRLLRIAVSRRQAHVPKPIAISAQVLLDRERCVLCTRCTRFSHRSPATRSSRCSSAPHSSRSPSSRTSRSTRTSPATPCRSARSGALTGTHTGSGRDRSTSCLTERVRTLRVRMPAAQRPSARQDAAPAGRRRAGGQRRMELRQGPVGLQLRHRGRPPRHAVGARRPATSCPLVARGAAPPLRTGHCARRYRCLPADGSPSKTPTPTRNSPASPWHERHRLPRPAALRRRGAFPAAARRRRFLDVTYADLETAPTVLLAGIEPEEESPIVYLRLRKAAGKPGWRCTRLRRSPATDYRRCTAR